MKKNILGIALLLIAGMTNATDYKTALTGKTLQMKGGNCAGLLGDQSPCAVDLPTRVRWLSADTFMLVEKNQVSESSPPRVFVYKVKSLKGNQVVLSEIWAGWNNFPDSDISYTIK